MKNTMAKKFIVFPASQIYLIDFTKVRETSPQTLTRNNDNTKAIVEIDTDANNDFLQNIEIIEQLDDSEVAELLATEDWFKDK